MRLHLLTRGELYRAEPVAGDPRRARVVLVVSRQRFIDSGYSTVMCVPVYSSHSGLDTQVAIGPDEGLKHASSLHCDEVLSVRKTILRTYVGSLSAAKLREVNRALSIALDILPEDIEDL